MRKKKRSMRKGKRQERPIPVNTHVCLEQDIEATGRQQAKGTGGSLEAGEAVGRKQGVWCFRSRVRSGSRRKGNDQLS